MKKLRNLLPIALTIVTVLALSLMLQTPLVEAARNAQDGPTNRIYLDVTYNPNTMNYSIGGLTKDQLTELGVPEIPADAWDLVKNLKSLSLKINNTEINLLADGVQFATIDWTKESRAWLYSIVSAYADDLPMDEARAEEWLDKVDIEVTIRRADTLSDPLVIALDTPLHVDITQAGVLKVEGMDTGHSLAPELKKMLVTGKVKHAAICWSRGVLDTAVNGSSLPQITLHQEGIEIVDQAFDLNMGDLSLLFQTQLGVDIVYGDGMHGMTRCGGE
jgi:hypothetical protein